MITKEISSRNGILFKSESGVQHGIFFRNPLQKIYHDASYANEKVNAWTYVRRLSRFPFMRAYERLIGNKVIVDNIYDWTDDSDFAGFYANRLMFPIYFKRHFRSLISTSATDPNIETVISYGYERPYNICSGDCDKEITTFIYRDGHRDRVVRRDSYYYTYEHVIEREVLKDSTDYRNEILGA